MDWSMGRLSGDTSLKKADSHSNGSHQLPIARLLGVRLQRAERVYIFLTELYTLHIATTWMLFLNPKGPTFAQYRPAHPCFSLSGQLLELPCETKIIHRSEDKNLCQGANLLL